MKAGSIYRIKFSKDYERIITWEKIRVGKRIRDIEYDQESNKIFV